MDSPFLALVSVWVKSDWDCNNISICDGNDLNLMSADIQAMIELNAIGTQSTTLEFQPMRSLMDSNIPVIRETTMTHLFQLSDSILRFSCAKLSASRLLRKSLIIIDKECFSIYYTRILLLTLLLYFSRLILLISSLFFS